MGSAFAQKLSGFGCRVIAYDKYRTLTAGDFAEQVDLTTLQRASDVISLHLPETDETHHFVNDAFIAACSKSFVLINTARGMNVDTAALVRGLESGAVSGACLDVLEFEKRSFEGLSADALPDAFRYLIQSDRVILSPHIAGWTHESYVKLSSVLADKLEALFG
jgi:D-3-phosphoglycerate dehydrogenase